MKKVPVIRRIPVPVENKTDGSFTNVVQIGLPNPMTSSVSDSYDNSHDDPNSSEEN